MISFIRLRTDDAPALRALAEQTFRDAFAAFNTPQDMDKYVQSAFAPDRLAAQLADPDVACIALRDESGLCGYIKLNAGRAQTDILDEDSLEIERVYVRADRQNAGLGGLLIRRAKEEAVAAGKKRLWLGVWEKNEGAIRFYEKNGFYRAGTHEFMLGDDRQTDLILRFDLSADAPGLPAL